MMNEGGYVDDTQKIDQPTLNKYNADHPNFNFPETVKDLTPEQVQQIYTDDYYDAHHIGEIKNERTHIKILYRKTPAK
jgi:lysozyme family protein